MKTNDSFQSKKVFTKDDTTFFKGIGILLIVFHNYCHLQKGFNLENEASFDSNHIREFWAFFTSGEFNNIFYSLMGYLGHYGVQIFIFFSAYGLTIQFSRKKVTSLNFVIQKLKKIYFLIIFAIVFWIAFNLSIGEIPTFKRIVKNSILLGSTFSSFHKGYLYGMFSGPFWFFALIVQLYVIFPFLYSIIDKLSKKQIWIPFVVSYLIFYFGYFIIPSPFTILGNIFGHLPEALLGIFMARCNYKEFPFWIIPICLFVFIVSQLHELLFPLSFLFILIPLIFLIQFLRNYLNDFFQSGILYLGLTSMILFIVNGPFRSIKYFSKAESSIRMERTFIYLIFLIIVSHFVFWIYNFLKRKAKL